MTVSVLKIKDISWLRKYVNLEKDAITGQGENKPAKGIGIEHESLEDKLAPRKVLSGKKTQRNKPTIPATDQKIQRLTGGRLAGLHSDPKIPTPHPKESEVVHDKEGFTSTKYPDVTSKQPTGVSEGASKRKKLQADAKSKLEKLRASWNTAQQLMEQERASGKPRSSDENQTVPDYQGLKKPKSEKPTTEPIKKKPLQAQVTNINTPSTTSNEEDPPESAESKRDRKANIKRLQKKPAKPKTIKDEDGKEIPRTKEHEARGYKDKIPSKEEKDKKIADQKSQEGDKKQDSPKKESWQEPPETVKLPRDTQEGGTKFHFGHSHGRKEGEKDDEKEHKQYSHQEQREVLGTEDKGSQEKKLGVKHGKRGGAGDTSDEADGGEIHNEDNYSGTGVDVDSLDSLDEPGSYQSESSGRGTGTTTITARGHRGSKQSFPMAHPPTHFKRNGKWTKVPESLIHENEDKGGTETGSSQISYHLEGTDEKTGITAQEVYDATGGESNIRNRDDYKRHKDKDEEFNIRDEDKKDIEARKKDRVEREEKRVQGEKDSARFSKHQAYKQSKFGDSKTKRSNWDKKTDEEKDVDVEKWEKSEERKRKRDRKNRQAFKSDMYTMGQKLMAVRLKSLK